MRLMLTAVVLCLGFGMACGKDESKAPVSRAQPPKPASNAAANTSTPSEFNKDIDKICNAESLSGAVDLEKGYERAMTTAKWLAANLRTPEGRRFLGETSQLGVPAKKAKALAAQAEKSGVLDCPLVRTWSGNKPANKKKAEPAVKAAVKTKPAPK